MAQYLILIYEDEASYAAAPEGTFKEMLQEHTEFQEKNSAVLRGGEALQPTATATSIRTDATGGAAVTDGPFAEAKEALGGFYIVEAADLDEALAVAKQVPARFGGVEVRPVMVFE
jgi:hypothetical protein